MQRGFTWISYFVVITYLTYKDGSSAQTSTPVQCDETGVAHCMVPLQTDDTFAALLTSSNAFNLVTLTERPDQVCKSYSQVSTCVTPLLDACYNRPSGTYSAVAHTMRVFCDKHKKVLEKHTCLSKNSLLNKLDICQKAAGLYTSISTICQTVTSLRACVDGHVIDECEDYATIIPVFHELSEEMLLPLKIHHGCTISTGPGPNRVLAAPMEDCGTKAANCMDHLQDLSGIAPSSPSISVLLTMASRMCRAYSDLQSCASNVSSCQKFINANLLEHSDLNSFCTFNITTVEEYKCLQNMTTRQKIEQCDRNFIPASDIDINACRVLSQHKVCTVDAALSSCSVEITEDLVALIDRSFIRDIRVSRCTEVMAAYVVNSCLESDRLSSRLTECLDKTEIIRASNNTIDCGVLMNLQHCAEIAVKSVCGKDSMSTAEPLLDRVQDFARIKTGCREPEPPVWAVFFSNGHITPVAVASAFLVFTILFAILVLSITYCIERRRRPGDKSLSWPSSDKINKNDPIDATISKVEESHEEPVRGTIDRADKGIVGGESTLEVEEVKIQDQSVTEDYPSSWYGTR